MTNGCTNSEVNFYDSSTTAIGTINNRIWYFGDGSTSSLQNPTHIYVTAGTYIVSLKITTNLGCIDSIVKSLIVENKPVVNFTTDKSMGCSELSVNFQNLSTSPLGSTYLWDFGDTNTSSSKNPVHIYTTSGVYTIKHYVTTSGGCIDSTIKINYITVYPKPKTNFSSSSECTGLAVSFSDSSFISSGSIVAWNWNFGNGYTNPLQNPSHTYLNSGNYLVTLTTTSNLGCSDSIKKNILVIPAIKPIVKFAANKLIGCAPLSVIFTDSSITATESIYLWDFGDSVSSSLKNPTHIFTKSGSYTIKHYVTTSTGCKDSLIKTDYINVNKAPIAFFTTTPKKTRLPNATVTFHNQSSDYNFSQWNFGDSTLSNQKNTNHKYLNIGTYKVCLTAQNESGCSDTHCDTVTVDYKNLVAIPKAFTPNEDNNNDILKVRGGPLYEMEFKIFNEWGNLVFSTNNPDEGWDGTMKGEKQPEGTYEYTLNGKTVDAELIKLHGVVSLVR